MEFSDKKHNNVQAGSVKLLQTLYAEIQKLINSKREKEAIGALKMFLALYPDYSLAHNDLGVLYYNSGDKEKSLQHYQKAADLQPENITFQKNLADFYYVELGQVKEAMQIYNKIIAANPKDLETLLIMGHICVTLQLFNDAMDFYKIVLKLDPANKDARQNFDKLEHGRLKSEQKKFAVKAENLKKDDYLVSAIVSIYNSERFIRGCLEDLEAQTIADRLEIIVVNSGSEQNEEAVVKEFQEKYSNIKYIKTEQRETVYAAWNRGIKASSGKYITNANTDDRHRKDALEVMSKMLETLPEIALVYADVVITETENETFKNCTPVGYFHWRNWKREDLLNKGCFMGPQPMWRRDVHNEYGYFDDSFVTSGDYEFWLRISQTRNFLHIPVRLGLYLRSPESIEHSNRKKQREENNKIFKLYKDVNSSDKNISETGALLEPDSITSLKNLADFYYVEQGRVEDALKIYLNILAKDLKNVEVLLIVGHIYVSLQKYDDAKVFYKRVLEIEPQNRDARQNFDILVSSELPKIKVQDVESNIISDDSCSGSEPESKFAEEIYQSIQPLIKEKKFDEAIEKLEQLLKSYPDFFLAHNDLGVLYYQQGDKEKALDHYEKAAELEPENLTFLKNLADFYCIELGRLEDALQIYNKILKSDPLDVEVLFAIGYICESLQQVEDAKVFYSKILEIEPWNEEMRENLNRLFNNEKTEEISENIDHKSCNIDSKSKEEAESIYEVNQNSARQSIAENESENADITATIIINCSGKQKELNQCLNSIKKSTFINYNIIFINTGAAKGALKLIKRIVNEHKNEKYSLIEKKKNSTLADSYNEALKIAAGDYLVLMHDDLVMPQNWLSDMIECMNIDSETGLAGPISNNADGIQKSLKPEYQLNDNFFDYAEKFREVNRHRRVSIRKLSGFCVMLKQEVIEKAGLFDKNFNTETFMMQDYCLRAIIAGYQAVIAGDVYLHHNNDCKLIDSAFDKREILHAEQKLFLEKWSGLDAKDAAGKGLITFKALEKLEEFNNKGEIKKVINAFLEYVGSSSDNRKIYIETAKILANAEQFKNAFDTLAEIPQIDIDSNSSLSILEKAIIAELNGLCMAGLGKYDKAQEYADKALLLNRNFAPALNLKGMLAYKQGNNIEAENFFKMAVTADPSYGEPYTNLGTMKLEAEAKDKDGNEEAALELYERGFILAPAVFNTTTLYHAAMTAKEKYSRCEKFSKDASALFPNNKKIKYMMIDLLIKQNRYDEAMDEIESVIVKFGIDDGILAAAGSIRDMIGQIEIDKSSKKEKTVSLCMIVKNEENDLAKCLKSIKPIVDEMIVVDTGSTDRTKELARIFGAKTFDYKWTNDFSDARNYSISMASGSWVFVLDADEVISSRDYKAFRNIINENTDKLAAYLVTTRNYSNKSNTIGWMSNTGEYPDEETGGGWMPTTKARLFHNNSRIRFDYPVHEMLDPSLLREKASVLECNIPVHHYGKLDRESCAEKGEKYYLMGISKLEEMGDSGIALRELAVQAGVLGKNEDAVDLWQRFLAVASDSDSKFIGDAYVNMASAYGKIGKYEDASNSAKKAMELFPEMKEAPYSYAYAELYRENAQETISVLKNLTIEFPEYPPARFLLVIAYICSGNKKKGIDGLIHLKKTLTMLDMATACHEFAKGLVRAHKIDYALLLLEAAMESNLINQDILSLFSECLEKKKKG